jgi:Ser/Thr protein kinase RdoA (MazF antagonist)
VVTHPYAALTPDVVLDACSALGLRPDGRLLSLNSYENRVYQIGLEDNSFVVAKFYRPGRWTDEQIAEEHAFAAELATHEIPVVAPIHVSTFGGFRIAVYPRRGGRTPELENPEVLTWIGRFIGRIHARGATRPFRHREALTPESFGTVPRKELLESGFIPSDLMAPWKAATEQALDAVQRRYDESGNILWTDGGPHFVDLDDSRMGPAMQDLWMLLSGDRAGMTRGLSDVLAGYEQFMAFDRRELPLLEPLRTLRLIHYSAWIARRWDDPAFPAAFPWFNTQRYWQDRILELREQIALMDEPPLMV